ncbi:glycosyltransferase family 25 protein [Nitratireductor sp. GISD-1A_MAKvit]|uniref:glycosyltransferase family 25 protein n=1 Tax=Nitratireductor sp. GISD-1A_MAKvit TaxID=3234198 RepID=UPI0034658875
MRTLVINLERETDRLAHMRRVFGEQGLDFEVVKAVDATQLSQRELEAGRSGEPRFYELGAGEIACFLSHRKCWEIAAKHRDAYTIICEDDIFLGENASAVFGNADWVPTGTALVRIEACRPKSLIGNRPVAQVGGRQLFPLFKAFAGAGAYVISREIATEFLEDTKVFGDPVDQFLFNPERIEGRGLKFLQLNPAVAIQEYFLKPEEHRELGSALRSERRGKRRSGVAKLTREALRPFQQFSSFVSGVYNLHFSDRHWVRVPFL